jgi:hypothetical protein
MTLILAGSYTSLIGLPDFVIGNFQFCLFGMFVINELNQFLSATIFWDTVPCSPYVNLSFGGTYHPHIKGRESAEQDTSQQRLLPAF